MLSTFSIGDLRPQRGEWRIANSEWLKCLSSSSCLLPYSLFATRYSRSSLPSQIDFNNPLVGRDLVDGPLRQHRAFVQAGDLDAELADERHVVLDHHDGLFLV